jgi:hypothetical protein
MSLSLLASGIELEAEVKAFKRLRLHETREEWLNAAIVFLGPLFEEAGAPVPDKVRVSIGFGSTGRKSSRVGECWDNAASVDSHFEIFIRPEIEDAIKALDILAHELVHAAVGLKAGHGKPFRDVALAIGLTGKMKSTVEKMHSKLGAFPHAPLMGDNGRKKQTTRLINCECKNCFNDKGKPYSIRMSREFAQDAASR